MVNGSLHLGHSATSWQWWARHAWLSVVAHHPVRACLQSADTVENIGLP